MQIIDQTNKEKYLKDSHCYRRKSVSVRARQMKEPFRIETREGTIYGEAGDFLVEGVEGEIYPCNMRIFLKTYDLEE